MPLTKYKQKYKTERAMQTALLLHPIKLFYNGDPIFCVLVAALLNVYNNETAIG